MKKLIIQLQENRDSHPKYKWADGLLTRKGKIVVGLLLQTKKVFGMVT